VHPKRKDHPEAKCPKVSDGDLNGLVVAAWDAGWWCVKSGKSYAKCYPPNGDAMIVVVSTPSSSRTFKNTRGKFRRAGLDV
jgi:hypothetical protein